MNSRRVVGNRAGSEEYLPGSEGIAPYESAQHIGLGRPGRADRRLLDLFSTDSPSESSGSANEIDDLQQDVAAEIAGNSYASGDVAFSVSSARQVLAVDLRNFQPLENTRYVLADCEATVIADDDRAFNATGQVRFHAEDERGLVLDQVDLLSFEEQAVLTIPVPAPTAPPAG